MHRPAKRTTFISTLTLLAALQVPLAGFVMPIAISAERIDVRGGVHDNYNRLVFDWPRAPRYQLNRDGDKVEITFQASADLTMGASARKLSRLTDFNSTTDGTTTTVRFRVDPQAKVEHFISGSYVVVDVQGEVPAKAAAPAPTEAKPPTAPVQTKLEIAAPASQPGPKIIIDTGAPAQPAAMPVASAAAAITAPVVLGTLDLPAGAALPPVALYQRADNAYAVFDRRIKLKPTSKASLNAMAIDGGSYSAYRLPSATARLDIVAAGPVWQLIATSAPATTQAVAVKTEPHYALGARLVVPIQGGGSIVSMRDPIVGDTLFVVPTTSTQASNRYRQFADLDLLPADRGLVVRPLNDKLTLRPLENAIEIALPDGAHLSDPARAPEKKLAAAPVEAEAQPAVNTVGGKLFFDLESWRQRHNETYPNARLRLEGAIVALPVDARNKARLDMVKLFIANGYGREANGMLALMVSQEEGGLQDLQGQPEFKALQAAANMLAGRQTEALAAFVDPNFAGYNDLQLWRAATLTELHRYEEAVPLFTQALDLLKVYPEPLFSKFALLAAEAYVAQQDYAKATAVIDQLAARTKGAAIRLPEVMYLRGVLQSRTGTFDAARKLWEDVSKSDDQLARTRARFALIDLNLATGDLKPADATVQLERLRYGWRGDDLELQMLERLSELYSQAGQPAEALETLDRAKKIFPNPDRNTALTEKQRKLFFDFFTGDQLSKTSPLKVLSIFNRYKEYAPTDPVQTHVITERLVERMLSMDLLPQAADLLTQRLSDESDPATRAKLGAQQAGIRLLDKRPDDAIKALAATDSASLPADILEERKLLRARALAEQAKYAEALQLLAGDTNEQALRLSATTAWQGKKWAEAATALTALLPDVPATPLTAEQAQIVINRAVALNLSGDQAGITALANKFGTAMGQTAQSSIFSILTDPDKMAGNLAGIGAQAKGTDLFAGFLENYRK